MSCILKDEQVSRGTGSEDRVCGGLEAREAPLAGSKAGGTFGCRDPKSLRTGGRAGGLRPGEMNLAFTQRSTDFFLPFFLQLH